MSLLCLLAFLVERFRSHESPNFAMDFQISHITACDKYNGTLFDVNYIQINNLYAVTIKMISCTMNAITNRASTGHRGHTTASRGMVHHALTQSIHSESLT